MVLNQNLEMFVFVEGRKPENPCREKPMEQGENQPQMQPTYDTGQDSNPDHIGGRRALSPLHYPCQLLERLFASYLASQRVIFPYSKQVTIKNINFEL